MFKCELGNHLTKPGERCVRVVLDKRTREYQEQQYDKLTRKPTVIRIGNGWEIAKEVLCCWEHVPNVA